MAVDKRRQVQETVYHQPNTVKIKNLDKDISKYQRSKRARAPRGASAPSFKGLVGSMVSIILTIGLLSTVIIGYNNSLSPHSNTFYYFSPSVFFQSVSGDDIKINRGLYKVVLEPTSPNSVKPPVYWHGVIYIDGYRYISNNTLSVIQIPILENYFTFSINGVEYKTITISEDNGWNRYLRLPDLEINRYNQPDVSKVVQAWSYVNSVDTAWKAINKTAVFVGEWIRYSVNLAFRLTPWNVVQVGERDYLDTLLPPLDS